jgi:hypothetical protein
MEAFTQGRLLQGARRPENKCNGLEFPGHSLNLKLSLEGFLSIGKYRTGQRTVAAVALVF